MPEPEPEDVAVARGPASVEPAAGVSPAGEAWVEAARAAEPAASGQPARGALVSGGQPAREALVSGVQPAREALVPGVRVVPENRLRSPP